MAAGLYDITNEVLGKGHFAVVKLAKHCLTGEHVAIKIIDKAKLNKEGLDQLSSEIRLWSQISEREHPNVVKLYQCIDTRTKLYLVMEYCGGQVCDLYDHIQKKNDGNGLAEDEARSIFRQVCNAILYCHSLKIVHRDLKPENILIISNNKNNSSSNHDSSSGTVYPVVKLIDFGFSNQWAENELFRTSCGSLAYSAPEILLGNQYQGSKVDIWALGCILYIILYGCNPFMQFNDNETLIKILDCSFTTPEKATVSASSVNLINGLLKKEPENRLTMEQILSHPWLQGTEGSVAFNTPEIESPEAAAGAATSPLAAAAALTASTAIAVLKTEHDVHEHIIEQMIDQGIALSKDAIKRILLRNEHSPTETEAEASFGCQASTKKPSETDEPSSRPVNDHHYIKATYQLLKDKSLREGKGVEQKLNNYNKRGNILKKANYAGGVQLNNKHRLNLVDRSNAQKANLRLLKPHFVSLDVPSTTASNGANNNNGNSFPLPLARKCSIVSEEGSLGGEQTSSSLGGSLSVEPTVEMLSEQPENTTTNTHPPVDIFVTDLSADNKTSLIASPTSSSAPPPPSSTNATVLPLSITESISEFSLSQSCADTSNPASHSSSSRHHITSTKLGAQLSSNYSSSNIGGLHPVSSSPDLLTSAELQRCSDTIGGENHQGTDILAGSTDLSSSQRRTSKDGHHQLQPDTFDQCLTSSFNKDSIFSRFNRNAFVQLPKKQLNNVRVTGKASQGVDSGGNSYSKGSTSSVRVQCIVQSKSMNNIALAEQQQQLHQLQVEQAGKLATSMSSVSIKAPPPPRAEKTDCCSVS